MGKCLYGFLLVGFLSSMFLMGCASTSKDTATEEKVSTLPWNTPQKWEKTAPMGGAGIGY